jgi:hypothetical protein
MNITRVERDGVEFFTIDETGESGMSESGLARLCGVTRRSVNNVIRSLSGSWTSEKSLEPYRNKGVRLLPTQGSKSLRGQNADITLIRAEGCAKVIEYFAFESKYKTSEALFAYRKFAEKGITAWIQEMTDWHGNPVPKNGITLDFKTIDQLLDKKLDGTSYRVFLILQNAIRSRMTLTADEIMKRAEISRSTYSTAVTKLDELGLLPDWCKIQRKNQPEKVVRDRLQSQLGGKVEAYTKWGLIDLLTETELIEVKIVTHWKDAIGHLIAKSRKYPNHQKRLHLFGYEDPCLEHIEDVCQDCEIRVTFERVLKAEKVKAIGPTAL